MPMYGVRRTETERGTCTQAQTNEQTTRNNNVIGLSVRIVD